MRLKLVISETVMLGKSSGNVLPKISKRVKSRSYLATGV